MMEGENRQLSQLNNNLESTVFRLESELQRLQRAEEATMRAKIEEIQVGLAQRWRAEVEEEVGNYVRELESMREDINELRRGNRELLK
jgi:phage-related protein